MFPGLRGPSIVLTLVCAVFIFASPAVADECTADLARQEIDFCLDEQISQLNYDWKLTADAFTLRGRSCTTDSISEVSDLVIAIDRSSHAWRTDKENQKIGSDQISLARRLLKDFAGQAGREVALVLYAGTDDCQEFDGGNISMGTDFPCLFVPAGPADDATHAARLETLLVEAADLYAEGSAARSGDHVIAAQVVRSQLGFVSIGAGLMVMLTDGMSYYGQPNDPHGYLRASNYNSAQEAIQAEFPIAGFGLLVGQPMMPEILFNTTHADSIDTMCAASDPDSADCVGLDKNDPRSWQVNQLQPTAFLQSLAGNHSVVEVTSMTALDQPFADAIANPERGVLEAVAYSLDAGERIDLTDAGSQFTVAALPAGQHELSIFLRRGDAEHQLKLSYGATKISSDLALFEDSEMQCTRVATATVNPLDLSKLQGGAASCGVVAGTDAAKSWPLVMILLLPILLAVRQKARLSSAVVKRLGLSAVLITVLAPTTAAKADGINALHYQPVADGIGMTQKAYGPDSLEGQAGLFMDYANDVVELGGEKNKRVDSIMDDLVTAHFVGNVGLHRHISLGIHVPFIHKSDVARELDDRSVEGGQLGQPADISVSAKFRIYRYGTFNFGFMPVATIAQGDEELLLGDGAPNYGGHFLFSGAKGRFQWATSLGYIQREKPLQLTDARAESILIRGQTISSTGMDYKVNRLLTLGGNLQMKFTAGQSLDFSRNSPAEWLSTVKLNPATNLQLSTGFGTGLGKGFGAPDYRVFAGVAYIPQQPLRALAPRYSAQAKKRK